jgi:hypothetical protein
VCNENEVFNADFVVSDQIFVGVSTAAGPAGQLRRSWPLPPQPLHLRFLMEALRFQTEVLFGDGMVMEILTLKWFEPQQKIACQCGPTRRKNTTTKR